MKTKWTKKPPKEKGWYWVKYKKTWGTIDKCPACFSFCSFNEWAVNTARNNYVFKSNQKEVDLKFGPKIKEPEN